MNAIKITDFVNKDNLCHFQFYRKGLMYYSVKKIQSIDHYIFPVEISDLADATINNSEKSLMMMLYIRKAIEDNTLTKFDE
jgi:hypothetical protein